MNKNIKVLDEVCKGAKMGMEAICYVSDKTHDDAFKTVLIDEYSMYADILHKIDNAYSNYGEIPIDTNIKDKAFLWYGIQVNTIKNTSNSKLSEMLMQGTNMGIIEGRKLLNNNKDLDKNVDKLLNDFVKFQEETVETLKQYL